MVSGRAHRCFNTSCHRHVDVLAMIMVRSISLRPACGSPSSGNSVKISTTSLARSPQAAMITISASACLGDSVLEHCLTCTERADKSCTTSTIGLTVSITHTCFNNLKATRLLYSSSWRASRAISNHIHFYIVTSSVRQQWYPQCRSRFLYDGEFHGTYALLPERNHDFQRLEVSSTCPSFDAAASTSGRLPCQRHKMPFCFPLSNGYVYCPVLPENAIHFIEVVCRPS